MAQKWKYREHKGKQGKFRVGDLVQLSAYGMKTEQNENCLLVNTDDLIGLITEISDRFSRSKYPITVQWIKKGKARMPTQFFFRELKLKRS